MVKDQKELEQEIEDIYQEAKSELDLIYDELRTTIQKYKKKSEENKIKRIKENII